MKKRPISVSIIAWFLIVPAPIAAVFTIKGFINPDPTVQQLLSQNPMPMPVQLAIACLGLVISFVSGIGMLKGRNWSRFLYVIWSIIGFLIGIATSPFKVMLIPGIIIIAIVAFFLFRPKANEFFRPGPEVAA